MIFEAGIGRVLSSFMSELYPSGRPFWRSLWYARSTFNPLIHRKSRIFRSSIRGLHKLGPNGLVSDSSITGSVSIGHNSRVSEASLAGLINIGNFTVINGPSTILYSELNGISIGSFTSIAPDCSIYEINHHSTRLSTYNIGKNLFYADFGDSSPTRHDDSHSKGRITIGSDVWIGTKSVVLSGSIIGDGAIIGANSTVTGNIAPYSIAVGSPAKVISWRFEPAIIERLLAIKWWEWDRDKLFSNRSLFMSEVSLEALESIC